MAELPNDSGSLRLQLTLAGQERPLPGGSGPPALEPIGPGRVLCTAALEYLDQRDGQYWPFIRIPVVRLPAGTLEALLAGIGSVVQGSAPGFPWQPGEQASIGLQFGCEGAPAGKLLVEVGFDLGAFLAESAGTPRRPGGELALFRFLASQAGMVRFGDALKREHEEGEESEAP